MASSATSTSQSSVASGSRLATTLKTKSPKKKKAKKVASRFSLGVDLGASTGMRQQDNGLYNQSSGVEVAGTFAATPRVSFTLVAGGEKDLHDDVPLQPNNTVAILAFNGIEFTPKTKLGFSGAAFAPTNANDRIENSFQTAYSLRSTLSSSPEWFPKASLTFYLDAMKAVYRYETNSSGEPNLSYRGRVLVGFGYKLLDALTFGLSGYYQAGRTYLGGLVTRFNLGEELAWSISGNFAVYVAHSNGGDALRPNGVDSNVQFYDADSSTLSMGIRAGF